MVIAPVMLSSLCVFFSTFFSCTALNLQSEGLGKVELRTREFHVHNRRPNTPSKIGVEVQQCQYEMIAQTRAANRGQDSASCKLQHTPGTQALAV